MSFVQRHVHTSSSISTGEWAVVQHKGEQLAGPDSVFGRKIEELQRRLADLQGPHAPSRSLATVQQTIVRRLPFRWQRDVIEALIDLMNMTGR